MSEYFSIRTYEQYQHYKHNANPQGMKWLKLHANLLDNADFLRLPEISRWHYVGLLCVAMRNNNRIPYDLNYLKNVLHTQTLDLTPLFEGRFLILEKVYKKSRATLEPVYSNSSLDKKRIEKTRLEKKKIDIDKKPVSNGATNGATPFPTTWELGEDDYTFALDKHHLSRSVVKAEFAKFRDRNLAGGRQYVSWTSAFRYWLSQVRQFQKDIPIARAKPPAPQPMVRGERSEDVTQLVAKLTGKMTGKM